MSDDVLMAETAPVPEDTQDFIVELMAERNALRSEVAHLKACHHCGAPALPSNCGCCPTTVAECEDEDCPYCPGLETP